MTYALNWYGAAQGQSGYELITRGLLEALDKLGVKVSFRNIQGWNREIVNLPTDKTSRLKRMADTPFIKDAPVVVMQKWQDDIPQDIDLKKAYIYSLFETDKVPSEWLPYFERVKKVFTFSEFNRAHWSKTLDNVASLGFGIEDSFRYCEEPANILNKKGYTFLSVGDFTERKGFDILLDAYCEEFGPEEDVTLILKTHRGGFTAMHRYQLSYLIEDMIKKHGRHPRILLNTDKLYYDDLPRLYNACDCFVLATRGEGLGLPVAEAMSRGLPVIVTAQGGYVDFVQDGVNGLTVKCLEKTIDCVEYIKKCPQALNHKWLIPDKEDLKAKMRALASKPVHGCTLGDAGRADMFDMQWNDVAIQLLKEIFN